MLNLFLTKKGVNGWDGYVRSTKLMKVVGSSKRKFGFKEDCDGMIDQVSTIDNSRLMKTWTSRYQYRNPDQRKYNIELRISGRRMRTKLRVIAGLEF